MVNFALARNVGYAGSFVARKVIFFILGYFVYVPALLVVFFRFAGPTSETSVPDGVMILLLVIFMAAPVLYFTITWNRPPRWAKKLQSSGQRATATIMDVADTGVSSGGGLTVYVRLTLKVQPEGGGTPFVAKIETGNSRVGYMRAGEMLAVKYDPLNLKHVVIDDSSPGRSSVLGTNAMPMDSALNMLSNLRPDMANQLQSVLRGVASGNVAGGVYLMGSDGRLAQAGSDADDGGSDIADQLTKLDQLHREGSLTDAEYKAAKTKLLG